MTTTPLARKHRAHRGTIFASSWGYDQTNVDYWIVVKATPKMAYVRKLRWAADPNTIASILAVGGVAELDELLHPEELVKIHDNDGSCSTDPDSKYNLWFRWSSFANAYVWRGEHLYSTPAGFGH